MRHSTLIKMCGTQPMRVSNGSRKPAVSSDPVRERACLPSDSSQLLDEWFKVERVFDIPRLVRGINGNAK